VGVHLFAQQPQRACQTSQQASVLAKERGAILSSRRTRIPDFDRLIFRSRHDLGSIRGKRDRPDPATVRVRLLTQQLERACQTNQQASVLAKEGRF
jgi:hypothetical protein